MDTLNCSLKKSSKTDLEAVAPGDRRSDVHLGHDRHAEGALLTREPACVGLRHRRVARPHAKDRCLSSLPIFHIGQVIATVTPFVSAAAGAHRFSVSTWWNGRAPPGELDQHGADHHPC
jgi:hypothetical protein